MKLLFTHDAFSTQKFGGISRAFVEMIKVVRQLERESTFEVCGGLFINQYLENLPLKWGLCVPAVKYTGIIRKNVNNIFQKLLIRMLKPDVIHQTYYSESFSKSNIRTVITVPDMIHELYPQMFSDRGKTSILKRKCCDRADRIIVISNNTKNDLIGLFGMNPRKIQVIYLANSLVGVKPDSLSKPLVSNYIMYVGDRHGYKNFSALMNAYAHSEKVKTDFFLVCFGGGAFSSNEKHQLSALGIDKKVIQISGNDPLLALYYQYARALVYPSSYEGFGLPLLEAMSYSCPILCSNSGSLPEIAGDAAVFFNPKIPESIQEILEKSLFDDGLLNEMAIKGVKRNEFYSWENCARETFNVYRSLF
jgi:glycosyltransferase involved in cell wall biosynthesis